SRQDFQFAVDRDADRLEHPPSRMSSRPPGSGRDGVSYDFGKFDRTVDGPGSHDRLSNPPGKAWLSVGTKQLDERAFRPLVDNLVRRHGPARVHAHVQWSGLAVTETALRAVELRRAHPQVEKNGRDAPDVQVGQHLWYAIKAGVFHPGSG